jgi:hypothetical protein
MVLFRFLGIEISFSYSFFLFSFFSSFFSLLPFLSLTGPPTTLSLASPASPPPLSSPGPDFPPPLSLSFLLSAQLGPFLRLLSLPSFPSPSMTSGPRSSSPTSSQIQLRLAPRAHDVDAKGNPVSRAPPFYSEGPGALAHDPHRLFFSPSCANAAAQARPHSADNLPFPASSARAHPQQDAGKPRKLPDLLPLLFHPAASTSALTGAPTSSVAVGRPHRRSSGVLGRLIGIPAPCSLSHGSRRNFWRPLTPVGRYSDEPCRGIEQCRRSSTPLRRSGANRPARAAPAVRSRSDSADPSPTSQTWSPPVSLGRFANGPPVVP